MTTKAEKDRNPEHQLHAVVRSAKWYHVFGVLRFFNEQNKQRLQNQLVLAEYADLRRVKVKTAKLTVIFRLWFTDRKKVISCIKDVELQPHF